jgi:hypothetical protein
MVWKQALAFTMASETHEPDAVWCCGIALAERHVCHARIRRQPRPWTKANFGPVKWLPRTSIDPAIADLLPSGRRRCVQPDLGSATARLVRRGIENPKH